MSNPIVHKIVLRPMDTQTLNLPKGAELLHVDYQHGNLCLWYWFDLARPNNGYEDRVFMVTGTGQQAPPLDKAKHIGTVIMSGGHLVLHVFELVPRG